MGNRFFWPGSEIKLIENLTKGKLEVNVSPSVGEAKDAEFIEKALHALIFYLTAEEYKIIDDDGRKAMDAILLAEHYLEVKK